MRRAKIGKSPEIDIGHNAADTAFSGAQRGTEEKNQIFYKDLSQADAPVVELIAGFDAKTFEQLASTIGEQLTPDTLPDTVARTDRWRHPSTPPRIEPRVAALSPQLIGGGTASRTRAAARRPRGTRPARARRHSIAPGRPGGASRSDHADP